MNIDFKGWFETVQLLKNNSQNRLVNLGKLGWWTVYYTLPGTKNNSNEFINYNSYLNSVKTKQNNLIPQLVDIDKIRNIFNEAAYRLSKLGFPQMGQVVVIKDYDSNNPITGGKSAGAQYRKEHGIIIDSNHVDLETIIHEHAHAYWHNLPKHNKAFFQNYYIENVKKVKLPSEDLWQAAHYNSDAELDDYQLSEGWEEFIKQLNISIGVDNYFQLINASKSDNEQEIIAILSTPQNGNRVNGILKTDLTLQTFSGKHINAKTGNVVEIERYNNKFIINYYKDSNNYDRYEYPKSLEINDLLKIVEFNSNTLSEYQKQKFNSSKEIVKTNPLQFFVGKDKDKIENAFFKSLEAIASKFNIGKHKTYYSKYGLDQLFNKYFNYYNSWMAVVSRRLKNNKINDADSLKQAYLDVIKKSIKKDFIKELPSSLNDKDLPDMSKISLDKPEAELFRMLIAKSGATVSAYGAANIDELWATTVEYAATNRQVPPVLKKLIYKTISGI